MSGLDDISNLNESLTQGGKYTSNKSDLLGSFTELQENANEVIHSTIEQFLPGHFDKIDDGTGNGDDVAFVNTTDPSLNVLIDNFKDLAGQFSNALQALKDDKGYRKTNGGSGTYDLSFGYATEDVLFSEGATGISSPADTKKIYFVSRVDGGQTGTSVRKRSKFQYSELITDVDNADAAADPSDFIDNANAPDHLQLTCGNLLELKSGSNFFTVNDERGAAKWAKDGNDTDNTESIGDGLAIENQAVDDTFGVDLTTLDDEDLLAARKRMCNPYNIIEDNKRNYARGSQAGQKFAIVTYLATQITALVKEMNRRIIDEGAKITDADGNEIALTLAQLNTKYESLLAENANVDAHLETESLKFDSENLIYIGMLVATVTAMAVGFTSLAKKTDMS